MQQQQTVMKQMKPQILGVVCVSEMAFFIFPSRRAMCKRMYGRSKARDSKCNSRSQRVEGEGEG